MTMWRLSVVALYLLAATASVAPAHATSSTAVTTQRQWSLMDKCAKLAIAKFPDHTAEDLSKRDKFTHQCQRDSRVPIRDGLAPK
jgi:hypothetical protein